MYTKEIKEMYTRKTMLRCFNITIHANTITIDHSQSQGPYQRRRQVTWWKSLCWNETQIYKRWKQIGWKEAEYVCGNSWTRPFGQSVDVTIKYVMGFSCLWSVRKTSFIVVHHYYSFYCHLNFMPFFRNCQSQLVSFLRFVPANYAIGPFTSIINIIAEVVSMA